MDSFRTGNVPSVWVNQINDDSLINIGNDNTVRKVFIVIVSDRGPDNQIVYIYSPTLFQRLFGKPNLQKYGQGHYFVMAALRFNAGVYIIRASLTDSLNQAKNCTISNITIRYDDPDGSIDSVYGTFIFTNSTDALNKFNSEFISQYVFTDRYGFGSYDVGDHIYNPLSDKTHAREIISKSRVKNLDGTLSDVYWLKLDSYYTGTSIVDTDNDNNLLISLTDIDKNTILDNYIANITNTHAINSNSEKYFPGVESINNSSFKFTNKSNIVICNDQSSYDSVKIGEWIFPSALSSLSSLQIINKEIDKSGNYTLITDRLYTGDTSNSPEPVKSYTPITTDSIRIKNFEDIDEIDADKIWTFHGKGAGSYYNNLFIKGIRNTSLESSFSNTDNDGNILNKYLFMDIEICESNTDGTYTILEGPWQVSLLNSFPGSPVTYSDGSFIDARVNDNLIRNNNGEMLYIQYVINRNSQLINCVEHVGINSINFTGSIAEQRRLQVMAMFSESKVYGTNTVGSNGFFLENGSDGVLFDKHGNFNIYDGEIQGCIARAYQGILPSRDNSIQDLLSLNYQSFTVDYVISGGYPLFIQDKANELTLTRRDMLLLADTGAYYSKATYDVYERQNNCSWNNAHAMLYTQYMYMSDEFTGRFQWYSPVLHAMKCHLLTDDTYGIAEPVANIDKGAVQESCNLAYNPANNSLNNELDELVKNQLNPIIADMGSKYIIGQLTTLKKPSILTRAHAVKSLHKIKKAIVPVLKPFIQKKISNSLKTKARDAVNYTLNKFNNESDEKNRLIIQYTSDVVFDESSYSAKVNIKLEFVKTIEEISINFRVT